MIKRKKEISFETRTFEYEDENEVDQIAHQYRRTNPDGSWSAWIHLSSMVSMTAHIDASCTISDNVIIHHNAYIGPNCRIFSGVTIGENVYIEAHTKIMFHAFVGVGAKIFGRSYVSVHAYVGPNCVLECASVQRNAHIGEGSIIRYRTEVKERARIAERSHIPRDCELHHFREFVIGQTIRNRSGEVVEITEVPEGKSFDDIVFDEMRKAS